MPVAEEPYDPVTTPEILEHGALDPVLELLAEPAFLSSVDAFGGYSTGRPAAGSGRRWP